MSYTRVSNIVGVLALSALPVFGRNIDLSTVPARDTVQLTIYNAEDITLVRETRQITFKKGVNPLQFSWANTLIDPTSVQICFPKSADVLELLDTTFPHDKPQMLYWNVQSEIDGEAQIEITYFTSGLTWSADYECIANPAETEIDITGYVQVFNHSGEQYENAQVRLVVGEINLVEAVAELAQRRYGKDVSELAGDEARRLKADVVGLGVSYGYQVRYGGFGGGLGGSGFDEGGIGGQGYLAKQQNVTLEKAE